MIVLPSCVVGLKDLIVGDFDFDFDFDYLIDLNLNFQKMVAVLCFQNYLDFDDFELLMNFA